MKAMTLKSEEIGHLFVAEMLSGSDMMESLLGKLSTMPAAGRIFHDEMPPSYSRCT
jgi:hypothetical protein